MFPCLLLQKHGYESIALHTHQNKKDMEWGLCLVLRTFLATFKTRKPNLCNVLENRNRAYNVQPSKS